MQALVLLEDFNHTDICWKSSTMSFRQSRTPLYALTMWDVLPDQLATHAIELIMDIKTGCSLVCSCHALEEFTVLRDMGQVKGKVFRVKNFRKAEFQLFNSQQDTLGNRPREQGRRAELANL